MRTRELLLVLAALALTWAWCACDEDDDGVTLDSSHEGWDNPGCFGSGCHEEDDTHHSDLQPYECVDCHGTNGAPGGHGGDTPCGQADCHPNEHGNNGFPDPESCQTCH
jgi:hypothetical protein